ncbi:carbohydrate porin [Stenotrophomonas chelatiphaga]|uniref:carbohydrate porin n=1 Tax=Stenotrophomonas chelatiphaga TaxID=517011 RepID=UPI0028981349|nr:carbohydrate porin [Stenotrophomonas chelatiphaga]
MNRPTPCRHWLPLAGLLLSSSVSAAPHLLPDADGRRAALAARGVELTASYTSEDATNLSGGSRRTGTHVGQLALGATLDLERLAGWSGLQAQVSVTRRDGANLNERAALGQLLQSQEAYGRGRIWRLGSLWLGKQWNEGRVGLKLGRMAVGDDFNTLDCTAMSLAFCGSQPAMIVGDYWFNGPLSQWGAVLDVAPTEQTYLRLGAYQVNPRYADESGGGLRLAPSGTVGTLTPVELGWQGRVRGLQGHYAVGGWYSSAPRADAWQDQAGGAWASSGLDAALRSGAYGGWISLRQQFSAGDGSSAQSGLRGQLDLVRTDRRTGNIDATVHAIATYTGIGARASDQIGLGVAATEVNPRYARQANGAQGRAKTEYTAEAFYVWQAWPGVSVQPVVQYVVHPGGLSQNHDAMVLGVKTNLAF